MPYDNSKLDAIRIRLENHARLNEPIYYAVVIDDLEVIPRTADASVFATIDELIGPTTKYISISEYIGHTRNRKTTCFVMDLQKSSEQTTLLGLNPEREDQQQYIERQVAHATLQRDHSTLQTELNKLKHINDALLEKCDKLEEENSELKKLRDEDSQQSTFLTFATDLMNRFVPAKAESPLAGTSDPNVKQAEQGEKSDGQVHVAVSEAEYQNYQHFVEMFKGFDHTQQGLVSKLIEVLGEHPHLIEETFVTTFQKSQEDGN